MKSPFVIGVVMVVIILLSLFTVVFYIDTIQRDTFRNKLIEQGFVIVDGGVSPNARAYVNHADFLEFAHLNNITTLYNQGVYYYAYNEQTHVAYVTSVHWENYKQ